MKIKHLDLPDKIKIKIIKTKHGNYLAELVDYDVFTQAKSFEELLYSVNDLIYTYFDIPKDLQKHIWYQPKKESPLTKVKNVSIPFHILSSEEYQKSHYV